MRYREIIESVDVVHVPCLPVTGQQIGTLIYVISGSGFEETQIPFLAKEDGWHQTNPVEFTKGRMDTTLARIGELISDAALAIDARKKGLVSNPTWPMIFRLCELEALPPGSIVVAEPIEAMSEDGRATKLSDGAWECIKRDGNLRQTTERAAYDVKYMVGHLGKYRLVRYGR